MRKLFAATFALVMLYAVVVVVVASSISSSPAETCAPYALECEITQPGVANAEQFACASCSHAEVCTHDYLGVETEIVRSHSTRVTRRVRSLANGCIHGNCSHEAAIAFHGAYPLKLPSVAAVNSDVRDANTATCVEVEVLGVGV